MRRASWLVVLTLPVALAWGCGANGNEAWLQVQQRVYKVVCTQDWQCGEREVCGPQKRCVPRARPEPRACGSDDDCRADHRYCLGGRCHYAPPCMNLSGTYSTYRADQPGLSPVGVVLSQTQGQCDVTSRSVGGGAPVALVQGTLDAHGSFVNTADGGCAVTPAGDDTLRANCTIPGGSALFHLYAVGAADRFHPTRCGGEPEASTPCDGHKCVQNDAGQCSLVSCPLNSAQVPQCAEVP